MMVFPDAGRDDVPNWLLAPSAIARCSSFALVAATAWNGTYVDSADRQMDINVTWRRNK